MAQPWGLIIILLMRKCQRPGFLIIEKIYYQKNRRSDLLTKKIFYAIITWI